MEPFKVNKNCLFTSEFENQLENINFQPESRNKCRQKVRVHLEEMKLKFLLLYCVLGEHIEKYEANTFLRVRRANSRFEEFGKRGDLERECIEETCSSDEFHEVYDDHSVSDALLVNF